MSQPTTSKADKYEPPPWVTKPKLENCGLQVFKDSQKLNTITTVQHQSFVLFGRNQGMVDIKLDHPSISRRHALVGHGNSGNIYCMDLGSSHGTFVNGTRLRKKKRECLKDGYIIKFGASTREYHVKLDLDYSEDNKNGSPTDTKSQTDTENTISNDNDNQNEKKRKLSDDESNGRETKRLKLTTVCCRHLLVKHNQSRRPRSWKNPKIERSKDEAKELILKYQKQILFIDDGDDDSIDGVIDHEIISQRFCELAKNESDCNSAKRGGDLGQFGLGRMQKPFEECAFALKVNELSEMVETDSGIHLILRYE